MPSSVGASRLLPSGTQLCKLIILLIITFLGSASVVHFLGVLDLLWQYCGVILAVLAIASILWLFWITPAVVKQPFSQEMEEFEMTGAAPNLQESSSLESSRLRARKPRLDATAVFSANSQRNARMAKPRRPEPGELRKTAVKFYTLKHEPLDTPPAEVDDIIKIAPDHAMVETWSGGWEPIPYSDLAYWADWKEKSRQAEKEREIWWSGRHLREEQQAREEKEAQAKREAQLKKEAEAMKKAEAKEEAEAKEKEALAKQKAEEDEASRIRQNALNEAFKKVPPFTQGTVIADAPHTASVASPHATWDSGSKKRRIHVLEDTPVITGAPVQTDGKASFLPVNEDPNPNETGRPQGEKPTPQCFLDKPTKAGPEIEMEDSVPGPSATLSENAAPSSCNSLSPGSKDRPEQGTETATEAGPEVNMGDVAPYPTTCSLGHAAQESSNGTAADEDMKKAAHPQDILRRPIVAFDEDFDDDPRNPPRADAPEFMQLITNFSALFIEKPSSKIFREWIAASAAARAPAGGFGEILMPQLPSYTITSAPLPSPAPSATKKPLNKPESKCFSTKASTTTDVHSVTPFVFNTPTSSKNPKTQNLCGNALPQPAKTAFKPSQQDPKSEKDARLARERAQIDAVSGDWNQRLPEGGPATAAGTVPKDAVSKKDANAANDASNSKTAAPSWTDAAKHSQGLAGGFGSGVTSAPNAIFSFGVAPEKGRKAEAASPSLGSDRVATEATPEPSQHHPDHSAGQIDDGSASKATPQIDSKKRRPKPLNIFEVHAKSPKSLSAAIKDFLDELEDPFDELDAERAGLRFVKSKKFLDKYQSITKFINKLCIFAAPKGHWDEQRLSRTAAKDGGIMTAKIFHKVHMKLETLSSRPDMSGKYNEPSVQAAWAAMKRLEEIWTHAGGFVSQATATSQAQMANKQGKAKVGADRDSAVESAQETTNVKSVAPRKDSMAPRKDSIMEIDVVTKQHEPPKAPKMSSKSQGKQPAKDSEPDVDAALSEDEVTKQLYGDDCTEDAPQKSSNGTPAPPPQASTASTVSTTNQASKKQLQHLALPGLTLPKQLFPKAFSQVATDSAMMDVLDTGNNGKTAASAPAAPRQSRSAPASDTTDAQMTDTPGANTAQTSAAVLAPQASTAQQLQSASAPSSVSLGAQMANSPLNGAGATQSPGPAPTVQPAPMQLPLPPFVPPKRNRFLKCKDKKSVVELLKKELSTSIWMQSFSSLSNKDPPATWTTQAFLDNCKLIKELFEEIKDYVVRDGHWIIDIISHKEGNETGIDSPKYKRVYNELVVLNQDHGNNHSAIREAYEAIWPLSGTLGRRRSP